MKTTSSVILSPSLFVILSTFVILSINSAKNLSVPLRACPEFIEGINFAKNLILSISYETLYSVQGDTFRTFARASIIKI